MTRRRRGASAAWTAGLVACATVALIGIVTFMMHVHRGWGGGAAPSRPPTPTMPASVQERDESSAVPVAPSAGSAGRTSTDAPTEVALDEVVATLRGRALVIPVSGLTAAGLAPSFGQARGSRVHEALDVMAPAGTPVVAVEDGTVAKLFTSHAGGLTIYQFDPSRAVAYYYAHLQEYAPGLKEGAELRRGQVIGRVGITGNASPDAPHLHFAIFVLGPERKWSQGTAIDPYLVLR